MENNFLMSAEAVAGAMSPGREIPAAPFLNEAFESAEVFRAARILPRRIDSSKREGAGRVEMGISATRREVGEIERTENPGPRFWATAVVMSAVFGVGWGTNTGLGDGEDLGTCGVVFDGGAGALTMAAGSVLTVLGCLLAQPDKNRTKDTKRRAAKAAVPEQVRCKTSVNIL
jgi:hypothetical protein